MCREIPANWPSCYRFVAEPGTWRERCRLALVNMLRDFPFRGPEDQRIGFYGPGRVRPGEIIQITDDNWTLHVQAAFRGEEERESEIYGLRVGEDILVSIDIERGPRVGAPSEPAVFEPLRLAALDDLQDALRPGLWPAALRPVETRFPEHLVWERLAFCPECEECVMNVAERLATYVRLLMPAADDAMRRWAAAHDIVCAHVG